MDPHTVHPTGASPDPPPEPSGPLRAPSTRRQRAGFSVFFDELPDEGPDVLETRIYHEESGTEAVFRDADPVQWIAWIQERVSGSDDHQPMGPRQSRGTRHHGAELIASLETVVDGENSPRTTRVRIHIDVEPQSGTTAGGVQLTSWR